MGRQADALSEKQVATLEWIRDGCAAVDGATEVSRKISAASLKSRGLATVKGAGAKWRASITPAGRAWLEAHPMRVAEAVGGPDGLIARVLAAAGHLAIGGDAEAKVAHEELVRLSHHAASRPRGWRLEVKNAGSWAEPAYEVVLVRHFEDLVEERPVPVPERVTRYHPSVMISRSAGTPAIGRGPVVGCASTAGRARYGGSTGPRRCRGRRRQRVDLLASDRIAGQAMRGGRAAPTRPLDIVERERAVVMQTRLRRARPNGRC
ncbi:MAG TPA: hypothetical protein VM285_11340 [Polyangia bacterium]|nr:hypothetical protein [Polyangia bacterium]